jgi:hypothetical protein
MQDQKFLRYRSLTLRAIAACVYISEDIFPARKICSNGNNGEEEGNKTRQMTVVIESLITKLETHHAQVLQDELNFKCLESPVQGPDRSRLTLYAQNSHCELLTHLLRGILRLQNNADCLREPFVNAVAIFAHMVEKIAEDTKTEEKLTLKHREMQFEHIVNTVEVRMRIFLSLKFNVTQLSDTHHDKRMQFCRFREVTKLAIVSTDQVG